MTSGSIVCPSCGAGVRKSSSACPYCGAEVVLPKPKGADGPAQRRTYCTRCGRLYDSGAARCARCPPAPDDERGSRCPRCGHGLEVASVGSVRVDRCSGCRGQWFDGDEIEHAIDVTTKGVGSKEAGSLRLGLPAWKAGVEDVRYLACVRCGERMARRQAAPRAGFIVDVCRDHGVWFDGGEFEHFTAFVRAGGLEVLRHDEIAAAESTRRTGSPPMPLNLEGRPRGSADDVLLVTVFRALGALLRGLF